MSSSIAKDCSALWLFGAAWRQATFRRRLGILLPRGYMYPDPIYAHNPNLAKRVDGLI